jgi:hypothetical protein
MGETKGHVKSPKLNKVMRKNSQNWCDDILLSFLCPALYISTTICLQTNFAFVPQLTDWRDSENMQLMEGLKGTGT